MSESTHFPAEYDRPTRDCLIAQIERQKLGADLLKLCVDDCARHLISMPTLEAFCAYMRGVKTLIKVQGEQICLCAYVACQRHGRAK